MKSISRRQFGIATAAVTATTTLARSARADGKSDALESITLSKATLDRVLADPVMTGFGNALGGARGVLVMPKLLTAGFIVGYTTGTGILLARLGGKWSDGVFIHLHQPSAGFQAGVQSAQTLMLLMATGAPGQIIDGSLAVGGGGGFSLGSLGIGGGAGGGASSGLNMLTVNYANGLYAGSNFSGMQTSLDSALNSGLYGAGFDARKMIATAGTNADMAGLRGTIDAATARAQAA